MGIDNLCINTIMMLSADAVQQADSGHPGMPMGDAAMAYVLWQRFLKHNPRNPAWPNRDRFVLSAGHGSMLLYSLLYLTGHDITLEDIKGFRRWGSKTPGHPEHCLPSGIETTTGPLGQGFATAVGMAMAERYLASLFNKPRFAVVDHYTYVIASDGDLMEGVSSEAASLAGHLGLGKLICLYSDNRITIEGPTDLAFTEDVAARFQAMGWHTESVDGYDLKGVAGAIGRARREKKRPSLILARTRIGYCSPTYEDTAACHGAPLGEEEIILIKHMLGLPEKPFRVSRQVLTHMRGAVGRGREAERSWQGMMKKYRRQYPELAALREDLVAGRLPDGWERELPSFKPEDGPVATRSASGKVLNALADALPHLIGGSADLAPSNNTYLKGHKDYLPGRPGRNIHFGVREHAMGAVLNGMALSGMLIPYGGTFLVFSDYLRPASRLSAMMGRRVVYVMTHDSVGLGEDGPTHQPVEHLAAYRAMPNMTVIRPADASETVEAWRLALANTKGPTMLVLTRQKLPVLDRKECSPARGAAKGGYVLWEPGGRRPDVILIASGSEVHPALAAARTLTEEGLHTRVVSMCSMELFDAQSESYRKEVLPPEVPRRLAVEAGASLGWHKYVGTEGGVLALDRFGASAPGKVLFEKFGFTAENIARLARELAGKKPTRKKES
ncbi:MAG: transketolase [Nitrospirota bacterium]|jgi:transketolase